MFGFGRKSKEATQAKELLKSAFQIEHYFRNTSGADAIDFVEAVVWAWDLAHGDDPIDAIDTDDDVKRGLKLDVANGLVRSATTYTVPRRLGHLIVAIELHAQYVPHLDADLAKACANSIIEKVQSKAVAMVSASGGKHAGETDTKALLRHIGFARATGDRERSAVLLTAVAG